MLYGGETSKNHDFRKKGSGFELFRLYLREVFLFLKVREPTGHTLTHSPHYPQVVSPMGWKVETNPPINDMLQNPWRI